MRSSITRLISRVVLEALTVMIAVILAPQPAIASQTVHRFYSARTGTHFYTADETECADVQRRLSSVFTYEGVGYRTPLAGENPDLDCRLVPLFRFYNADGGSHFYTTSETERDDVIARLSDIFHYEGVAYEVVGACSQVRPVYRFYNVQTGTHFYTVSDEEKTLVEARYASIYRFEGVAYYALPPAEAAPAPVKNIIIMIGDGMGYDTLRMTDYYLYGATGTGLPGMTYSAGMSTYAAGGCYDPVAAWADLAWLLAPQTDSASAATAMSTGIKTLPSRVGVVPSGSRLTHLMEAAEADGRATGVVSSMPFSHATPAGFVAHVCDRAEYATIAEQMISNSATDAIFSCGSPYYDNDGRPRSIADYLYIGESTWGALTAGTAGGDADGDGDVDPWTLLTSTGEIVALGSGAAPARVCGVAPAFATMQQGRGGDHRAAPFAVGLTPGLPTLAEMSLASLNVLDADPDGFVLMIEGGAIDQAAHVNTTGRVIEETADFEGAVRAVDAWVTANSSWSETLLIVTADHETGRPSGPGSGMIDGTVVWKEVVDSGVGVVPGVEWHSGDHTAALVPFFAKGVAAHRFGPLATATDPVRGPYLDNTDIARVCFTLLAE